MFCDVSLLVAIIYQIHLYFKVRVTLHGEWKLLNTSKTQTPFHFKNIQKWCIMENPLKYIIFISLCINVIILLLSYYWIAIIAIIVWLYSIMHDKLYAKLFPFSRENVFEYSKVVIYGVR